MGRESNQIGPLSIDRNLGIALPMGLGDCLNMIPRWLVQVSFQCAHSSIARDVALPTRFRR